MTSLEEGKWLILLQKDLKHNRHQRGEKKTDIGDYDDDDDDDYDYDDDDDGNDDYAVFSSSQRASNRVGTRGSRYTMMMMIKFMIMTTMMMMMMMMIMMMVMVFFFFINIFIESAHWADSI